MTIAIRSSRIAETIKGLGYVERFAMGIAIAQAALLANGNPPARFRFEPSHVQVIVEAVKPAMDVAASGTSFQGDMTATAEEGESEQAPAESQAADRDADEGSDR